MTTKGILYFNRPYDFADEQQAEIAHVALQNIANGSKSSALIETNGGRILVTSGVDLVLYDA